MLPHELLTQLTEIRHQRPHARVLVIEAHDDDTPATARALCDAGIMAGTDVTAHVLVATARFYVRKHRTLGPVDIAVIHNRNNVARADRSPSYATALQRLQSQPRPVRFIVIEPAPLLGVTSAPDGWACGSPFVLPGRFLRLGLPAAGEHPCGFLNDHGTWHCASCGDFRGITYKV